MTVSLPLPGSFPFSTFLATFTPLDWFIFAFAVWSVVRGFMRGLIRELFTLIALFVGITAAAWNDTALAVWLARWLPQPASAEIAAFLVLAFGVTVGILLVGRLVRSAAHLVGLGLLDRLAGAVFGLLRACLIVAVILMACITFLPAQSWLQRSRLTPPLLRIARTVALFVPADLQQRISSAINQFARLRGSLEIPTGSNPGDGGQYS